MTKYYKGFNKDMTCNGFQYEEGKEYEFEGEPILCRRGFHVCEAPLDVLRYYPNRDGNVFREVECEGITDERHEDSKRVCKKIRIGNEIGVKGLIEAHRIYIRKKAESGEKGGDYSNLVGGNCSNLAGGDCSNLAGGNYSNLVGGYCSNLAGGNYSNLVGGYGSNLAGGDYSNLVGGNYSNLMGGNCSNLAGGDRSNLVGGYGSLVIARTSSRAKAGLYSIIVLSRWDSVDGVIRPVEVKSEIVDGVRIKPDTWYKLEKGEFVEAKD